MNYWDLPFNGLIDELKIYEASLSAAEIRGLDIDHLSDAQLLASAASLSTSATSAPCERISSCRARVRMRRAISWESSNPAVLSTIAAR